jgi:hypothetical protein
MHEWLIEVVIKPSVKSLAELCEKHGISFVCYIEHKPDEISNEVLTHHLQADCSKMCRDIVDIMEGRK